MKQLLILTAFLILGGAAFAQKYVGFAPEFYAHQPNARAEAMGRGNGAVPGGPFQTYYNAAASSFTEGANAAYTKLEPNTSDFTKDWYYYNYGASYNTEKYGALAFNYFRYSYGSLSYMHYPDDPDHVVLKNVSEIFTINYSYKFANDLAIGVSGNFFNYEIGDHTFDPILLDIGVLKKFVISGELYKQNVYAGISFNNILNQKAETEESGYDLYRDSYTYTITEYLPSTLRVSGAYEIKYDPEGWVLMPASLIASAEYQDMLNSEYYTMIKLGTEITLFEIFKTRLGFYTESNNDHGYFDNVDRLNEFTYGFGLSFPIYKLAPSVPLEINADYVNLENPAYYKPAEDAMKNYNLFTVSAKIKI